MKYLVIAIPLVLLIGIGVAWISAHSLNTPPRAKPPIDENPPEKFETATFALG